MKILKYIKTLKEIPFKILHSLKFLDFQKEKKPAAQNSEQEKPGI